MRGINWGGWLLLSGQRIGCCSPSSVAVGWIKVALIDSSLIICLFLTGSGPFDFPMCAKTVNNQSLMRDMMEPLYQQS